MAQRGNPYHKPAGSPNSSGGEFTSGGPGGVPLNQQRASGMAGALGYSKAQVPDGLSTGDKTSDAAVRSGRELSAKIVSGSVKGGVYYRPPNDVVRFGPFKSTSAAVAAGKKAGFKF